MKYSVRKTIFLIMAFVFFLPVTACANMVWPSLYIAEGMRSWFVILAGLILEIVFVKLFLKQTILKSAYIAFVMNLISTIVGIFLIPFGGFVGEFMLAPFGGGTFALSHWIAAYILAVVTNTLVEGLVVNTFFRFSFKNMFLWLLSANTLSVIICILFHGLFMENIVL